MELWFNRGKYVRSKGGAETMWDHPWSPTLDPRVWDPSQITECFWCLVPDFLSGSTIYATCLRGKLRAKWDSAIQNMKIKKASYIILSRVKQITSPGWMHETSARGWCTGKTQRDGVGREAGGEIGMGNTCKSMADSCQCMTKTTTIL